MRLAPFLLILTLIALASVSSILLPSNAQSSTCTIPTSANAVGSVVRTTNNAFYSITYGTTISWSQNVYASEIESQALANCIAFTNAALGASSNPSWSFAVGSNTNGNLNITAITTTLVNTTISKGNFTYYYESAYPSSVTINGTTTLLASAYATSLSEFNSAYAPSVYLNTTTNSLQVNSGAKSTTSVIFSIVQNSPSPPCTFNCGSTGSTTPPTFSSNSTFSISNANITMKAGSSAIALIQIDNSQDPSTLSITSITVSSANGTTVARAFPLPFNVGPYSKANLELNVSTSKGLASGEYSSNVTFGYSQNNLNSQLTSTLTVTIAKGPATSFAIPTILLATIIAAVVVGSSAFIIVKKVQE